MKILILLLFIIQTKTQLNLIGDVMDTLPNIVTNYVYAAAYHPDGTQFAIAGYVSPDIWIYDVETYTLQKTLTGSGIHTGDIYSLNYSPDGVHLASTGIEGSTVIWDHENEITVTTMSHSVQPTQYGQYSRDGTLFISCNDDNTAKIYALPNYTLVDTLSSHTDVVRWGDISLDNSKIATASDDQSVIIWSWDGSTATVLYTFTDHTAVVKCVLFSPDGQKIASAGWDYKIFIYDANTGDLENTMFQHTDVINYMEYTSNGRLLVTASEDLTIRIWDVANSFYPKYEFKGADQHTQHIYVARVSPDQRTVLSGSRDHSVKFWFLGCPYGFYADQDLNCLICSSPCADCIYQGNLCTECVINYELIDDLFCAKAECSEGYYLDTNSHSCQQCNELCATCTTRNVCIACKVTDNPLQQPPSCECVCGKINEGVLECVDCEDLDGETIYEEVYIEVPVEPAFSNIIKMGFINLILFLIIIVI